MKQISKVYKLFFMFFIFTLLIQVRWAKGGWEHIDPNTSNLPSSHINTLAMDPNMLWIGTKEGLVQKLLSIDDPNIGWIKDTKVDPNVHAPVTSMDIDQNMVLWLGTKEGLISYDPDESTDPNNPFVHGGLSFEHSDNISDIEVDSNFVWVATDTGLNRFDKSSETWVRYGDPNDPNGFDSSIAQAVASGDDDTVWVLPGLLTLSGGVYKHTVSTGQWDHFSTKAGPGQTEVIFNSLIMGDSNDIWLGSYGSGLWRFETNHLDLHNAWTQWEDANSGLPSNNVQAIAMDRASDRIIAATVDGIAMYDLGLGLWQRVSTPDYLDLSVQDITDILVDTNHNRVWFGTEEDGLYLWKVEFKTIIVPEVVDTDPDPDSTGVNPYAPVKIWFNKSMDPNSFFSYGILFRAEGEFSAPVNKDEMEFPDPNNLVVSISKDPPLEPGRTYTFTVDKGVTDISGNPLSENYEFQFTAKAAPQVFYMPGFSPYPDANDVSVDTNIAVIFDSSMDTNSVEGSFSLKPAVSGPTVTGTFSWFDSDTRVAFLPDSLLTLDTQYEVTIDTNARDKEGIPLNYPVESPFTWSFRTYDTIGILSIFPAENEDNVSIYANIEIKFSTPMTRSSVEGAFGLSDENNEPVSGEYGWNQDSTEFSFIPSDPLYPNRIYKASITTSAQSQSGSPLEQGTAWQFTTVSPETVLPPEGGWPVLQIMGMDPNVTAVTAMALDPADGGIWAGLTYLDPNSTWMGIGLFHYDGSNWRQYASSDPNCGLTSDYINDLVFDSQGNLWIATEPGPAGSGGGVNMFDGQGWHWYDPNTFYGLSKGDDLVYGNFLYVNAIDVYDSGTEDFIWIAASGGIGIGRYNVNSGDWEWSATTTEGEFPFPSVLSVDKSNKNVWVASDFLLMDNPNEPCNSIVGFDAYKLTQWQPDLWDPNLDLWDPKLRVWSPNGALPRTKSPEERINSNLRAMTVDRYGNLWMGTRDRLYKISTDDLRAGECDFESCNYVETEGGLLSDSIYDIIINPADTDDLWFATDSGISVLKITKPIKSPDSWTRYPTGSVVLTMTAGSSGEVYAGTDKGLLIIGDTKQSRSVAPPTTLTFEGVGCFIYSL